LRELEFINSLSADSVVWSLRFTESNFIPDPYKIRLLLGLLLVLLRTFPLL
jgi:hypothetical protein